LSREWGLRDIIRFRGRILSLAGHNPELLPFLLEKSMELLVLFFAELIILLPLGSRPFTEIILSMGRKGQKEDPDEDYLAYAHGRSLFA
jgi:hypothetical protein